MSTPIQVLDHGYVRFIEAWGHGLDGEASVALGATDLDGFADDNEVGIIEAARQSTQGSFRGWERDRRLLAYLYNNKHSSPFEFAGMTIEVQAPIFVFREWMRSRTQSYNEASARYGPLPDVNYLPTRDRLFADGGKNTQAGTIKGAEDLTDAFAVEWLDEVDRTYALLESVYQRGLFGGVPKEIARIVLPVGRYSKMRACTDLRNWLGFLTLRTDPAAQFEIRQFANAVGQIVAEQFPRTWALFRPTPETT